MLPLRSLFGVSSNILIFFGLPPGDLQSFCFCVGPGFHSVSSSSRDHHPVKKIKI